MPKNKRIARQRDIRTVSAEKYDGLQANPLISPLNPVASREEAGYPLKWETFKFRVRRTSSNLVFQFLNLDELDLIGEPTINITDRSSFYLVFPEVFQPHLFEHSPKIIHDEIEQKYVSIKSSIRSSDYGIQFDCMIADGSIAEYPASWSYLELKKRIIDPADALKITRAYVDDDQTLTLVFNKKINRTSFGEGDLEKYFTTEGSVAGPNIPINITIASDGMSAEFGLDVPFLAEETITLTSADMEYTAMANDCTLMKEYTGLVENLL